MGKRIGIMLAYPLEEKRLLKWGTERVIVQPKLDGERCRALIYPNRVELLSSEGNMFYSVPHIEDALADLSLRTGEIDGELYCHGMSFSEIHSIVSRTENIHPDREKISFHAFDLIDDSPQIERLATLSRLLQSVDPQRISLVEGSLIENSPETIMNVLKDYCSDGYEGIIVRHPEGFYSRKRSTSIMKFKPRKSDTYRILSVVEEISKDGNPKDSLGALILSDKEGTTFGCGTGFSQAQRSYFWEKREFLPGMYAKINYQQLSDKHVPRFPVFIELVDKEDD